MALLNPLNRHCYASIVTTTPYLISNLCMGNDALQITSITFQ